MEKTDKKKNKEENKKRKKMRRRKREAKKGNIHEAYINVIGDVETRATS